MACTISTDDLSCSTKSMSYGRGSGCFYSDTLETGAGSLGPNLGLDADRRGARGVPQLGRGVSGLGRRPLGLSRPNQYAAPPPAAHPENTGRRAEAVAQPARRRDARRVLAHGFALRIAAGALCAGAPPLSGRLSAPDQAADAVLREAYSLE